MLDVKKNQSTNKVEIVGILNELNVETKKSAKGKDYVSAIAKIRSDIEIGGKLIENESIVKMFAMKEKSESSGGGHNPQYDKILALKDNFTSMAAAENPSDASRVYVLGRLEENIYVDRSGVTHKNVIQLSAGTLYPAKTTDADRADFELSGVIGNIKDEYDRNGDETGRMVIQYILAKYNGEVDVLNLIAENPAYINHINTNWNKGDTVVVAGKLAMYSKIVEWEEDLGFGEPQKRHRSEYRNELIITKGSREGLDEHAAYDNDSVKIALNERANKIAEMETKAKKPTPTSAPASAADFFGDNF